MKTESNLSFIKVDGSDIKEIATLSGLATRIIKEHFDPIIGSEQNDYMIKKFQSVDAIIEQIEHGHNYYFICNSGKEIGFIAFYPRKMQMYLSKFYLDKKERGKGLSKKMRFFRRICVAPG
jgi:hypothetical protein